MRISDWSSDVCSSDLHLLKRQKRGLPTFSEWSSNNMDRETGPSLSNMPGMRISHCLKSRTPIAALMDKRGGGSSISSVVLVSSLRKSQLSMLWPLMRSEEHTSELQSLMRISSAVFCLKKQKKYKTIK